MWSALGAEIDEPKEGPRGAAVAGDGVRRHVELDYLPGGGPMSRGSLEIIVGPGRRALTLAAGILLVISGVIWILQGFDLAFAPQSFMTDNRVWVWWGVVAVSSGGGLIWWSRRSG